MVAEFTTHFRLPILVVGLKRRFTGGTIWISTHGLFPWFNLWVMGGSLLRGGASETQVWLHFRASFGPAADFHTALSIRPPPAASFFTRGWQADCETLAPQQLPSARELGTPLPEGMVLGVDPIHSFQPSLFSKTGCFPWVFDGFLKRRIPEKKGEGTPEWSSSWLRICF